MEDWGSEYGKNPEIKKTPKGEPYMKTGNTVKDEPPLNKIMPGTKAWDGIPDHILKMRSGGGCAATSQKKVSARQVEVVPLMRSYETYPKVDKEKAKTPANLIKNLPISVGGQNCHFKSSGAFTGEVSANFLKDTGCEYVLIGHSERRILNNENNAEIRSRAQTAINSNLKVILCVGERLADREEGKALEYIEKQINDCLPNNYFDQAVPRCQFNWNGDVWRAIVECRTKKDLDTYTCYADFGIGVIFKRENQNYLDLAIKDFSKINFSTPI